jgi:hypothetical protein
VCDRGGAVFDPRCAVAQCCKAEAEDACTCGCVDDLVEAAFFEFFRGADVVGVWDVVAIVIDSAKTPVGARDRLWFVSDLYVGVWLVHIGGRVGAVAFVGEEDVVGVDGRLQLGVDAAGDQLRGAILSGRKRVGAIHGD